MIWKEKFLKDELMKVEVRFNKREKKRKMKEEMEKKKEMKKLSKGRKKRKTIRKPTSIQKVDVESQSSHDSDYAEPVDDFFRMISMNILEMIIIHLMIVVMIVVHFMIMWRFSDFLMCSLLKS